MTTTYARARLWTGIGGVGTLVVLATAALSLGLPTRALRGAGGDPAADFAWLLALLLGVAALAFPLDWIGGRLLPRRYGRTREPASRWLASWARGVLVLTALSAAGGALVLAAGRAGGRPLAVLVLALVMLGWIALQEPLARLVGGLRRVEPVSAGGDGDVVVLEGSDPGFSGGFAGLGGRLVVPARWARELDPRALALALERRRGILGAGARRRAVLLALGWNVLGFTLASLAPGAGVASVAELATTALWFTLWTFLGLLLLPTPSRRATTAADALVARDPDSRARLAELVRAIDRLQDDEPERSAGVESVFHPVPSVGRRLRELEDAPVEGAIRGAAWHLARTALPLSHAGLSLLPRAVHCNAGRPELWIYLPTDG